MSAVVEYKVRDGVALITVNNPPINALTQPVREGLRQRVESAEADPDVGAIVIQAEGRTFPAGADLRDFHARIEPPSLGNVASTIEQCSKPVIAAIHGTALGGGLELALACHYRLAHVDAQLGLPDVALGAVPAAGASQRLPRIVGAKTALDLMLTSRPISAQVAERIGLVDKAIKKNLRRAAFGSARNFVGAGTPVRPTCARSEGLADPRAYLEAVEARRESVAQGRRIAVHKAIDLVGAALLLPFEAGLQLERATFEDLVESDQARGLRHAFLAEKRTTHGPTFAPGRARPHDRIGVLGAGQLAVDILRAAMKTGQRLVWYDDDTQALERALARIEAGLDRAVERGSLPPTRRDTQLARLSAVHDPEPLGACDIVIEALQNATPDELQTTYDRLGVLARPGTVFATATATGLGGLQARAQALGRPADVIALAFSQGVPGAGLVEVLALPDGAQDLAASGAALAQALGKVPVVPRRAGAGISFTLLDAFWRAAFWLVDEGAAPDAIDAAMTDYGFAAGPFRMMDRIGLNRVAVAGLAERMREQGWSGRAAGRGFYTYGEQVSPEALAPDVAALVADHRAQHGLSHRDVAPEEIVDRCIGALANAGARLVAGGVAARPSDIDATMVVGYGFPRWRGGPMEATDLGGLLQMRNRLRGFAAGRAGKLWQPDPLFDELIKYGRGFDSLNR